MSVDSLEPFPEIPFELKAEILSHCDASTLAKASSASLAFLELASPLLYTHITFLGPHGLKKFLTLRADVQVPTLAPYLDLSLIHSITYIDVNGNHFETGLVCTEQADLRGAERCDPGDLFVPHRLLPPGASGPIFAPLSINSLYAQLTSRTTEDDPWAFFDPVVARIVGCPAPSTQEAMFITGPNLSRWTHLRELTLVDAITQDPLYYKRFPVGPVTLRYELSVERQKPESTSFIVEDADGLTDDNGRAFTGVERVVVQVRTEDIKKMFLLDMAKSALLSRTTVVVKPAEPAPETATASPAAPAILAT